MRTHKQLIMDAKIKPYEKIIMQRLRDIAGITKSTNRNEFKKKISTP